MERSETAGNLFSQSKITVVHRDRGIPGVNSTMIAQDRDVIYSYVSKTDQKGMRNLSNSIVFLLKFM
jgi:hypothetical protein